MIYIDRFSVKRPRFFQTPELQNHIVRTIEHYTNKYHLDNHIEFDDYLEIPENAIGLELVQSLTQLFLNKCPFCESLVQVSRLHEYWNTARRNTRVRKRITKGEKGPDLLINQLQKEFDELKKRWNEEKYDPIMGQYFKDFELNRLIETSDWTFTEFRPGTWAKDDYGNASFEHYWWLAYEWENIFLCCENCASQKGDKFPIEGTRISRGQSTTEEKALLIDPCNQQDFEEEDISFEGARAIPQTKEGEASIEIYGLNRSGLLQNRSQVIDLALSKIDAFLTDKNYHTYSNGSLFSTGQPYLSAILGNARLNYSADFEKILQVFPFQEKMKDLKEVYVKNTNIHTRSTLRKKGEQFYTKSRSYSLDNLVMKGKEEKGDDMLAYFRSSKWISRIEIENFKIIKKLDLNFPNNIRQYRGERQNLRPWLVLLGENGVGKSSILQAVAMTLMGQKRLDEFKFDPAEYVTRGAPIRATVKVYLTDRPDPIILTIDKANNKIYLNEREPQVLLMGYGATRLLTKDKERGFKKDFIRCKNLFDPFEQLDNVQDWLRDPRNVDNDLFDAIRTSLADLLMLKGKNAGQRFTRERRNGKWEILFEKSKGEHTPLDYLSSGYKAVIALALDIMVGLFQIYGEGDKKTRLKEAEGTVLIDEIGVHLHPQWKMWIAGALRRTFPKMNFLVTTHEPLCLRGLEKGEVFVVKPDSKNGIHIETDLPSPKDLRVDQLLTSSFFGLNSILDPEVERQLDRYYQLKSLESKLSEVERNEYERLRSQVMKRNVMLGSTVQEELEYTVIKEKFEHFSNKEAQDKPEQIEKEIIDKLKTKWDQSLFD